MAKTEYEVVLADLFEQRDAVAGKLVKIDAAIEIVRASSRRAEAANGAGSGAIVSSAKLSPTVFSKKSLSKSIELLLAQRGEPQRAKVIERALLDGGYKTGSKNFYRLVSNTLTRMKKSGRLVNAKGKWGLPVSSGRLDDAETLRERHRTA